MKKILMVLMVSIIALVFAPTETFAYSSSINILNEPSAIEVGGDYYSYKYIWTGEQLLDMHLNADVEYYTIVVNHDEMSSDNLVLMTSSSFENVEVFESGFTHNDGMDQWYFTIAVVSEVTVDDYIIIEIDKSFTTENYDLVFMLQEGYTPILPDPFSAVTYDYLENENNILVKSNFVFEPTHIEGVVNTPLVVGETYTFTADASTLVNGWWTVITNSEESEWTGDVEVEQDDLPNLDSNGNGYVTFTASATTFDLDIQWVGDGGVPSFNDFMLEVGSVSTYEPVVDVLSPVINGYTGALPSQQSEPITIEYIQGLLTASDNADGDLTSSITITSDDYTSNNNVLGEHSIVFSVEDSAGNSISITVIVVVFDVEKPVITLVGPSVYNLQYGDPATETWDVVLPVVNITDNVDSNLVPVITSTFNYQALGTYTVTYNVTDSNGNVAVPVVVTVNVTDLTVPVITVIGDSDFNVEFGSNYTELGSTCVDDGSSCTAVPTGSVNVGVLGDYIITYTSTDASGNVGTTTRTVHVVDTIVPTYAFSIGSQITYTVGNALSSAEVIATVTASDSFDGDLTGNITVLSNNYIGNEGIGGSYEIRLSVADSSGNTSIDVISIVIEDNTPPVFSVSDAFMTLEEANAMTLAELYVYFGIE